MNHKSTDEIRVYEVTLTMKTDARSYQQAAEYVFESLKKQIADPMKYGAPRFKVEECDRHRYERSFWVHPDTGKATQYL